MDKMEKKSKDWIYFRNSFINLKNIIGIKVNNKKFIITFITVIESEIEWNFDNEEQYGDAVHNLVFYINSEMLAE